MLLSLSAPVYQQEIHSLWKAKRGEIEFRPLLNNFPISLAELDQRTSVRRQRVPVLKPLGLVSQKHLSPSSVPGCARRALGAPELRRPGTARGRARPGAAACGVSGRCSGNRVTVERRAAFSPCSCQF